MWNCPYSNESFPKYAEDIDAGSSVSVSEMSACAKESAVTLVAGSIPESSNGKLYNTCCIFDDQGKLLAKHRKVSRGLLFLHHLHHRGQLKRHICVEFATLYSSETAAMATTTASGRDSSSTMQESRLPSPSCRPLLINVCPVSAIDHVASSCPSFTHQPLHS